MFNKNKKETEAVRDENIQFEEMEKAEEFGDGWFYAGVATGVVVGVVAVLT